MDHPKQSIAPVVSEEIRRELEAAMRQSRDEWLRRLDAIQADRRRQVAPLDPDFGDQAIQRENDETLDALDQRGREELAVIDNALQRLKAGTYGRCMTCKREIPLERLRAQPTAALCTDCARGAEGNA